MSGRLDACKYCTNGTFGSCHPFGDIFPKRDWLFLQQSILPPFQHPNRKATVRSRYPASISGKLEPMAGSRVPRDKFAFGKQSGANDRIRTDDLKDYLVFVISTTYKKTPNRDCCKMGTFWEPLYRQWSCRGSLKFRKQGTGAVFQFAPCPPCPRCES